MGGLIGGTIGGLIGWVIGAALVLFVGTRLIPGRNTEADFGQVARVLGFAQQMVDDHTTAQNQLQQLASQKGAVLPPQLDSVHQSLLDSLHNKTGTDFDRAYLDAQITAHRDTIANVQNEANNGSDVDSKNLAQQLLPQLQHHLQMAKDIRNSM